MNLLPEAAAAAAVVLFALFLLLAGRRRKLHRETWIEELAAVRDEGAGVLAGPEVIGGEEAAAPLAEAAEPEGPASRTFTGTDGEHFTEYGEERAPLTRVAGRDHLASVEGTALVVELHRGSVWRLAATADTATAEERALFVRTVAAEIRAGAADVLVTCEPDGWTYVLCFAGAVEVGGRSEPVRLTAGQVARLDGAGGEVQVANAAPGALEGDEVVRLHRRLDRGAVAWPSPLPQAKSPVLARR